MGSTKAKPAIIGIRRGFGVSGGRVLCPIRFLSDYALRGKRQQNLSGNPIMLKIILQATLKYPLWLVESYQR